MPFLHLPREVRDPIYHYYVFEPEGYHFDHESGKLRASGNRPIDLALMYTCKAIAAEMHHVALKSNVLHFSTLGSEKVRLQAGRFDMYVREIDAFKSATLETLSEPAFHHYTTPDLLAEVALKYPQFEHLLQLALDQGNVSNLCHPLVKEEGSGSSWGAADSIFRDFQDYLLEHLSKKTDFFETYAKSCDNLSGIPNDYPRRYRTGHSLTSNAHQLWSDRASFVRSEHLFSNLKPWSIPTNHEHAQIRTLQGVSSRRNDLWKRIRWRYSAVAVAIQFFQSISHSTGLGIRKVVLNEDRRSVGYPECHALGLIRFCSQWPKLHIERRVNVWRNMMITFFADTVYADLDMYDGLARIIEPTDEGAQSREGPERTWAIYFPNSCAKWITEASALSFKGMPANSFSLILDGDPAPDYSSQLFGLLKDQAAWQVGIEQWFTEISPHPGIMSRQFGHFYTSEVFPQVISAIIEGKSFISCNFPTGGMYDPKQMINQYRHLYNAAAAGSRFPSQAWQRGWYKHICGNPIRRKPFPPPLPSNFCDLVLEEVMPEEEHPAIATAPTTEEAVESGVDISYLFQD